MVSLVTSVPMIPVTWALATFIVWLISRLVLGGRRGRGSAPPGPRPWPVIGNLNLIGKVPHQSLHKLSKTYGPLMQFKFGSTTVVVGNSPEMAKEFLKTHDSTFASRPQLAAGKYTLYNFSNITWSEYGPYWRQGRRVFQTHLFSSSSIDSYEYIRVHETRKFITRLYELATSGQQVRVKDHLFGVNIGIVSRVVLGKSCFGGFKNGKEDLVNKSEVTACELQEMLEEMMFLNGVFVIGDWIPWLARLDLEGYVKRMKKLGKKFDKFLDVIIEEHMIARTREKDVGDKDMLDVLLDIIQKDDLEVKWTIETVKALTLDLLTGGTDTAATAVEWTLAELVKNPDIIKKAMEELDRVVGRERWVEEEDMANLPYLDAVIKEALRLHPPATLLAPHLAMEDCQVKQYDISKGTLVMINVWSMGRDPSLWDSPEEFRPERFLNKDIDIKGRSFELLPFGSGRRVCPGYSLGIKMIQLSLANLLHGFNLTLASEVKPQDLSMEEMHGLTTPRKHPLVVLLEPRLSPHLYTHPCPP